ncbi:MAG: hypothetical protein M3082_22160, partial [Candidatus Dormibacteraeota bacterium]|nr:hypothetical protein [Candidatus Dormibacteraeota bacterium]
GIPVAIGFLASLLGLGGISDKIKSVIHAIQEPIHNVISKVLGVVLKPFKWIGNKIKAGAKWAKKKLQQGVAFVKDKAKQGMAFVKGKAAKLFGKGDGETDRSAAVKAKAHERLAARINGPLESEGQLKAIAGGVLAELRPEGLKELTVRPKAEEPGRYDVLAAASAKTTVFSAAVVTAVKDHKIAAIRAEIETLLSDPILYRGRRGRNDGREPAKGPIPPDEEDRDGIQAHGIDYGCHHQGLHGINCGETGEIKGGKKEADLSPKELRDLHKRQEAVYNIWVTNKYSEKREPRAQPNYIPDHQPPSKLIVSVPGNPALQVIDWAGGQWLYPQCPAHSGEQGRLMAQILRKWNELRALEHPNPPKPFPSDRWQRTQ